MAPNPWNNIEFIKSYQDQLGPNPQFTSAHLRIAQCFDSAPVNEILDSILLGSDHEEGLSEFRIKEFGISEC